MIRTKIDYGIDLGTTNSAISRMENGEAVIKKTDIQKDTMSSCVFINRRQIIQVGDSAYHSLKNNKLSILKNWSGDKGNAYVEFKRTMGTDKKYPSSHLGRELSSEELSAEVLKGLKSFIKDESFSAAVITVPAAFKNNQIDATRRAAQLAGLHHVEVLQEPVAAAMAYGLNSKSKDGFWLIFDFGGGTFDSALLKVEDGIMKVIDTEGDNYLGGKNIDNAILDGIILPYFEEEYAIDSILENDTKKQAFREGMRSYAEEIKIGLSFNDEHAALSDLGAIPGEDDKGEELELDLIVTQTDFEKVAGPLFQKAIDKAIVLLKRNNLNGNSLDSLILVGGPTYSPILRKMIEEQITKPEAGVDPMTVVSRGAALYASTVDLSEELKEQTRDKTKVQIEIGYPATSVETEEFITIKTLPNKTNGSIPDTLFAEIISSDEAWSSGKKEINEIGEILEVSLNADTANNFKITLYDNEGNHIESQPSEFTIIQGIGGVESAQGLTLNWGIEIKQTYTDKIVFKQVPGLEKNSTLPVTGIIGGLKTQKKVRPSKKEDFIKIPLYQGEHEAEGTRAIHNEHVYDIIISGQELPSLLPKGSEVELTIKIDRSQLVTVSAFFPLLDFTYDIEVPTDTVQSIDKNWLVNEIRKAKGSITELKKTNTSTKQLNEVESLINQLSNQYNNNPNDTDTHHEVLSNLREQLKIIETLEAEAEWPELEEKLKEEFYNLEKAHKDLGNDQSARQIEDIRTKLEEIIKAKDFALGNALHDEIIRVLFSITFIYQLIGFIHHHNTEFNRYNWLDETRARQLLSDGISIINNNPTEQELHPIVLALIRLLPEEEKPSGDSSVLIG